MYIRGLLIFIFLSLSAQAEIISTLPEFSWVVKKLLPEIETKSLLEGVEDPHFIDASPSFVFKLAKTKVLILNGLELETGWLPKVIQMSGNAKIQPGSKGYCNASSKVQVIEKLNKFDRSMGDVHAMGNPHYSLSLLRMIEAADSIKTCLLRVGYSSSKLEKNFKSLKEQLTTLHIELKKKWSQRTFYVYHREFNYLSKDFPIKLKQSLEKVPGIIPSASYLVKIAALSKKDKPLKVLASITAPGRVLEKFKEISGISFLKIRLHPTRTEDYVDFIKKFHESLLK